MKYLSDSAWGNNMELLIRRAIAWFIDSLIVMIPTTIVVLVFGLLKLILSVLPILSVFSNFIWLSAFGFIFYMIYEVTSLLIFQTTIGKALVGIQVRDNQGLILEPSAILLRSFIKVLSMSGYFVWLLFINVGVMLIKDESISLHDWLAGSKVWIK